MNDVSAAVSEVVAAANEQAAETVTAVIEAAATQVEAAQENAQAIVEAAMQTEIGRQIETLKGDYVQCQIENQSLQSQIATMQSDLSELKITMAAALTLQAATLQPAVPASISLTPAVSEVKSAVETVVAALPGNLSENVVAESPVVEIPKARKRFL
jgi:NAD-specific glutamate dehydrogenase